VIAFLGIPFLTTGQTPFFKNFTPQDYGAATQTFSMTQDDRGVLYFGNTDGVLEYNGSDWRLIKTKATVRTLVTGEDGVVYVGTVGNIGRLVPDSRGVMHFESLLHKVPMEHRGFKDIWRLRVLGNEVFFSSFDKLLRFKNDQITVFEPKSNLFALAFVVEDDLYVQEHGHGLFKYNGVGFDFVEGSDFFATPRIYTMFPIAENRILIGTKEYGLSIYSKNQKKILPLPTGQYEEVVEYLTQYKTYSGTVLEDGNFVIGTILNGYIMFTPEGKVIDYLNDSNGFNNTCVYNLNLDNTGLLWASKDNGISSINYNLPFKQFTEMDGYKGTIFSMENHNGDLYIGTGSMSFRMNKDNSFTPIEGTERQNWHLKSANDKLLVAHNPFGYLEVDGTRALSIPNNEDKVGVVFCDVEGRSDLLIAAAHEGLFLLRYLDDSWQVVHQITGFKKVVYTACIDEEGTLWARCAPNDLYKITLNETLDSVSNFHKIEVIDDEEIISSVIPYPLRNQKVVFGSESGAYQYNYSTKEFEKYPVLDQLDGDVSPIYEDSKGNIWYEESKDGLHIKGVFRKSDKGWTQDVIPFYKFSRNEIYKGPTSTIIERDNGDIAFATIDGLLIYDTQKESNFDVNYNANIHRIYINDTFHVGSHTIVDVDTTKLSYDQNNIGFEYSAYYFEGSDRTEFSYRLKGRNDEWSEYSTNRKKEFTNLDEGDFTFEVKARNLFHAESNIASYSFSILPPWYRTKIAYLVYLLAFVLSAWGLVVLSSRRLRKKNERLEQIINDRTVELRAEKEKSDQLSSNLLRIFTIIGHDMKRPVLSFRGITKKVNFLLKKKDFQRLEDLGTHIEEEAQSLHQLTDNLLNWALMQKSVMPYQPNSLDLNKLIFDSIDYHLRSSTQKGVKVISDVPPEISVYADENAILTILRNLIDNAIKYSKKGGVVRLTVHGNESTIDIVIEDQGLGMSQDQVDKLFTSKNSTQGTHGEKGTGIGLHLVRELVEINKGSISIKSKLGKGSTFTITLPKGQGIVL